MSNPNIPAYPVPQPYAGPLPAPGPGEPFDGASSPEDLSRPLYGASFGQAVKRFFKNYANFSGRASRSEFWWVALFTFLIQLIPFILYIVGLSIAVSSAAKNATTNADGSVSTGSVTLSGGGYVLLVIGVILLAIIGLALLIPGIAIHWRRLHDANLAGPFWFLSLTSVGSIVVLVFTILPSKPEGRRFISNR